ncbi:MAG: glutamate--tRNA ligase [Actinomycetota bacterium]
MKRFRFAPSPTGGLHIGTARTALFNWLAARSSKGKLILRIEDTDFKRSKKEYENSITGDLKWLGLEWDSLYRQSDRLDVYKRYAFKLLEEGLAYRCFCTPQRLEKLKKQQYVENRSSKYDNKCRNLSREEIEKYLAEDKSFAIRFKINRRRDIVFNDLIRDEIRISPDVFGDFVILKSDNTPSYNFAVVIDDGDMGITHVLRGEDHITNTARQMLLFEGLGWEMPEYAHLSMILGKDGSKLSKRHGATTISQFRDMGYLSAAMGNYLSLLSWAPPEEEEEIFEIGEIVDKFKISGLSKSPAIFDIDKLNWINGNHIRATDTAKLFELSIPFILQGKIAGKKEIKDAQIRDKLIKAIGAYKKNLKTLAEIPGYMKGLFEPEIENYEKKAKEILELESSNTVILRFLQKLEELRSEGTLSEEKAKQLIGNIKKELKGKKIKGKYLYMPVRVSLTGMTHGPELPKVISILGIDSCIKRVKQTLRIMN